MKFSQIKNTFPVPIKDLIDGKVSLFEIINVKKIPRYSESVIYLVYIFSFLELQVGEGVEG